MPALIEVHTGSYCDAKTAQKRHQAFLNIVDAVKLAHKLKLSVKAGHGLCYKTIKAFKGIPEIEEFSIGHSIVSRAVLTGMQAAVTEMIRLIKSALNTIADCALRAAGCELWVARCGVRGIRSASL